MLQLKNHHQSSRKGISMVFVYLVLLLITVFSGLIVYFMSSSLINDYILRTLGLRLTLHGLTLYTNTMYTLSSGRIEFDSSFPEECTPQCIDCAFERTIFNTKKVYCDCENEEIEQGDPELGGNILKVRSADETALVCDDNYILNSLEPVILFVGRDPVSAGFKADLTIYPLSLYFQIFRDELANRFGGDIEFFRNNIYVFTETSINLNDYGLVRRLLTDAPTIYFKQLLGDPDAGWIASPKPMESLLLKKKTYDNFESMISEIDKGGGVYEVIGDDTLGVSGLLGLIDAVLRHSSYTTINGNTSPYRFIKGNKGVLCPMNASPEKYTYDLTIRPGLSIVQTGSKLCEYECYEQNSLESECLSGEWHEVFCFDFMDIKNYPCDECFADDVTYNIDLCGGECIGNTSPDYKQFVYTNIYTGTQSFGDASESILIDVGGGEDWLLSDDCIISVNKEPGEINLSLVFEGTFYSYDEGDELYAGVYDDVVSDTGATPWDSAFGDFDGDGISDVVGTNFDDDTISVLFGVGDGSFTGEVIYDAVNPWDVATGDFDGDGDIDIVTSDYANDDISVLFGVGDGSFAPAVPCSVDDTPDELVIDIEKNSHPYEGDEIYAGVYDEGDGLRVRGFDACDSEGVYAYALSSPNTLADLTNIIDLEDIPSKTSFYSILTGDLTTRAQYKVFLLGDQVGLEPTEETDLFTKMVKAPLSALRDRKFELEITNPEMSAYVTQDACEAAGFGWSSKCFDLSYVTQDACEAAGFSWSSKCFDPYTLDVKVECVEACS